MTKAKIPNMEELLKNSAPSTLIKDAHKEELFSYWKGTYSKEYILKNKIMTEEEYERVIAYVKPVNPENILRYQIFGYETF